MCSFKRLSDLQPRNEKVTLFSSSGNHRFTKSPELFGHLEEAFPQSSTETWVLKAPTKMRAHPSENFMYPNFCWVHFRQLFNPSSLSRYTPDGKIHAPADMVYIQTFCRVSYIPCGAGFLPSTMQYLSNINKQFLQQKQSRLPVQHPIQDMCWSEPRASSVQHSELRFARFATQLQGGPFVRIVTKWSDTKAPASRVK